MSRGAAVVAPPPARPAVRERIGAGRLRDAAEFLLPFATVAVAWELFAAFGPLPAKLFPSLGTVAQAFWRLLASGILLAHAQGTIVRLVLGFLLAAVLGIAVGLAMADSAEPRTSCCRSSASAAPSPGSPTRQFGSRD